MGFWNAVGSLAKKAGEMAIEEATSAKGRVDTYKLEMKDKRDNDLFLIVKRNASSSPLKSGAAMQELKSRGFSVDDIKQKVATI